MLYILMRTDVESLTPGKACAQASHATNDFEDAIRLYDCLAPPYSVNLREAYDTWKDGSTFGTTIVLGADSKQLDELDNLNKSSFITSSWLFSPVIDPTYPIRDGDVTHHVPFHTCSWVFAPPNIRANNNLYAFLSELDLY